MKSGKFKDVGSPIRKMTDEERTVLQTVMNDVHDQFIEAVAEGRSIELTEARTVADGRVFTGRQAKELKLVDELGDLDDAIQLAADLGGIEGEPRVIEPRKRFSVRDLLESKFGVLVPGLDWKPGVSLKYLMAF